MWCTTTTSSSPWSWSWRIVAARSSGPAARSNGRATNAARSAGVITGSGTGAGGWTSCHGPCSSCGKLVRSASCLATTAVSRSASSAVDTAPLVRMLPAITYASVVDSWVCTQIRRCAADSGNRAGRLAGASGRSAGGQVSRCAARAAMVGCSNTARSATCRPSATRTRAISWVASSDCPPAAKKSSVRDGFRTARSSDQIAATATSVSPRGGWCTCSTGVGSGSRPVSSLPLTVSGSSVSGIRCAGCIQVGSWLARWARSSARSTSPTR